MKIKLVPTLEVVAAAIAAYEHNNRSIVRNPIAIDGVEYHPNRHLITESVLFGGTFNGKFIVNDFHRKQADGVIQYIEQNVIMQSLRGKPDHFLGILNEILANKEVAPNTFGRIAWAPHLVEQYQQRDHVRELSARHERMSRYTGRIGETVTVDFTLIEKRYIQSTDCYAVYGYTEHDNLVFYWAKNLDKVCEVGRIQGRVKSHREEEYRNNAKVTVLNYVKVL
jgi:hypothetical protein